VKCRSPFEERTIPTQPGLFIRCRPFHWYRYPPHQVPAATPTTGSAMSIEDILQNAPRYEDIVTAYGLDVLGGDLQVTTSGDIAVTVNGDLKFGNDRVNAMAPLGAKMVL
jgi:hypothetical protein